MTNFVAIPRSVLRMLYDDPNNVWDKEGLHILIILKDMIQRYHHLKLRKKMRIAVLFPRILAFAWISDGHRIEIYK